MNLKIDSTSNTSVEGQFYMLNNASATKNDSYKCYHHSDYINEYRKFLFQKISLQNEFFKPSSNQCDRDAIVTFKECQESLQVTSEESTTLKQSLPTPKLKVKPNATCTQNESSVNNSYSTRKPRTQPNNESEQPKKFLRVEIERLSVQTINRLTCRRNQTSAANISSDVTKKTASDVTKKTTCKVRDNSDKCAKPPYVLLKRLETDDAVHCDPQTVAELNSNEYGCSNDRVKCNKENKLKKSCSHLTKECDGPINNSLPGQLSNELSADKNETCIAKNCDESRVSSQQTNVSSLRSQLPPEFNEKNDSSQRPLQCSTNNKKLKRNKVKPKSTAIKRKKLNRVEGRLHNNNDKNPMTKVLEFKDENATRNYKSRILKRKSPKRLSKEITMQDKYRDINYKGSNKTLLTRSRKVTKRKRGSSLFKKENEIQVSFKRNLVSSAPPKTLQQMLQGDTFASNNPNTTLKSITESKKRNEHEKLLLTSKRKCTNAEIDSQPLSSVTDWAQKHYIGNGASNLQWVYTTPDYAFPVDRSKSIKQTYYMEPYRHTMEHDYAGNNKFKGRFNTANKEKDSRPFKSLNSSCLIRSQCTTILTSSNKTIDLQQNDSVRNFINTGHKPDNNYTSTTPIILSPRVLIPKKRKTKYIVKQIYYQPTSLASLALQSFFGKSVR